MARRELSFGRVRYGNWVSTSTPPRMGALQFLPEPVQRSLAIVEINFDPRHDHPTPLRALFASLVAIVGSLVSDAILVAVGVTVFPSTRGFAHFQFSDYATLTVIGVGAACVAWPIVSRISSSPRWLFLRMAVVVTLVLWLPDVWILLHGEPAKAVAVLMTMHLAIAFITYNALVRLAPLRPLRGPIVGRSLPLNV